MRILLDMDGVVADFSRGACQVHRRHYPFDDPQHRGDHGWDMSRIWGITPAEFWAPIARLGADFWSGLHKTTEADQIVYLAVQTVGIDNVAFCTQPQPQCGCLEGKMEWVEHHFPLIPVFFTTKDRKGKPLKHWLANASTILIDDNGPNVDEFQKWRGNAFLFPRPWNRYHRFEREWESQLRGFLGLYGLSVEPQFMEVLE